MLYKELNCGVKMPMLGFGTFQMSGSVCEESVIAAIHCGYRLIDTAEAYGNEDAVGAAIVKSNVKRNELFITTKVNFRSYENARKTVENSLKNLHTDYLDMVLLHWPFGNYYHAWRELEELQKEGKIRAIGVSNFDPDRFIDLIEFNKVKPAINQIETHLFCQRKSEGKWLKKYGIVHQAYAPLGQGRANEIFDLDEVKAIAAAHQKTPAQVLLHFLIQSGTAVIPKSCHIERIRENIDIFDFDLTAEELNALSALDRENPMIGKAELPEFTEMAMKW